MLPLYEQNPKNEQFELGIKLLRAFYVTAVIGGILGVFNTLNFFNSASNTLPPNSGVSGLGGLVAGFAIFGVLFSLAIQVVVTELIISNLKKGSNNARIILLIIIILSDLNAIYSVYTNIVVLTAGSNSIVVISPFFAVTNGILQVINIGMSIKLAMIMISTPVVRYIDSLNLFKAQLMNRGPINKPNYMVEGTSSPPPMAAKPPADTYTSSSNQFCANCGSKLDGKFCSVCGHEN